MAVHVHPTQQDFALSAGDYSHPGGGAEPQVMDLLDDDSVGGEGDGLGTKTPRHRDHHHHREIDWEHAGARVRDHWHQREEKHAAHRERVEKSIAEEAKLVHKGKNPVREKKIEERRKVRESRIPPNMEFNKGIEDALKARAQIAKSHALQEELNQRTAQAKARQKQDKEWTSKHSSVAATIPHMPPRKDKDNRDKDRAEPKRAEPHAQDHRAGGGGGKKEPAKPPPKVEVKRRQGLEEDVDPTPPAIVRVPGQALSAAEMLMEPGGGADKPYEPDEGGGQEDEGEEEGEEEGEGGEQHEGAHDQPAGGGVPAGELEGAGAGEQAKAGADARVNAADALLSLLKEAGVEKSGGAGPGAQEEGGLDELALEAATKAAPAKEPLEEQEAEEDVDALVAELEAQGAKEPLEEQELEAGGGRGNSVASSASASSASAEEEHPTPSPHPRTALHAHLEARLAGVEEGSVMTSALPPFSEAGAVGQAPVDSFKGPIAMNAGAHPLGSNISVPALLPLMREAYKDPVSPRLRAAWPKADVARARRFSTCAVVGNGGIHLAYRDGAAIDAHEAVFRFNAGPTRGFEAHVGSRTTIRLVNREHVSFREEGRGEEMRLQHVTTKQTLAAFVKARKEQPALFALDPAFYQYILSKYSAGRTTRYYKGSGKSKVVQAMPTNGYFGVKLALQLCDTVTVYGFIRAWRGYVPYHYFDNVTTVTNQQARDNREFPLLLRLAEELHPQAIRFAYSCVGGCGAGGEGKGDEAAPECLPPPRGRCPVNGRCVCGAPFPVPRDGYCGGVFDVVGLAKLGESGHKTPKHHQVPLLPAEFEACREGEGGGAEGEEGEGGGG